MEKYFYVYYSYEEYGRGYIGKRECKKHTEETKKIISEKAKGRVAPNKGKPHSEETKRKISEIRKKQYEMKKLQLQQGGNQS